jgi:hypothetical protein
MCADVAAIAKGNPFLIYLTKGQKKIAETEIKIYYYKE